MKKRRARLATVPGLLLVFSVVGECGTLEMMNTGTIDTILHGGEIIMDEPVRYAIVRAYPYGGGFLNGTHDCTWYYSLNDGTNHVMHGEQLKVTAKPYLTQVRWTCKSTRKADNTSYPNVDLRFYVTSWYKPEPVNGVGHHWMSGGEYWIHESFSGRVNDVQSSGTIPSTGLKGYAWTGSVHYADNVSLKKGDTKKLVDSECLSGSCSYPLMNLICLGEVCGSIRAMRDGTPIDWGQPFVYRWGDTVHVLAASGENGTYSGEINVRIDAR